MGWKNLLFASVIFILASGCNSKERAGLVSTVNSSMNAQNPAQAVADTVWVAKSDLAKSCGSDKGVALDSMANELESSGIKVHSKKKLHDSKMRIQMCGADRGDMNGFLIPKKDQEKASELGFKVVTALDR